jgi:hypothetical protein
MAESEPAAGKESRSRRNEQEGGDSQERQDGHKDEVTKYEQELANYLRGRIKPGLNSSAIPLLARSIAKEIAHWPHPNGASEDDGAGDEPNAEAEDEQSADGEGPPDFEAEMYDLQAELGEDWILRFSVQGDEAWLTAEKEDGSQRVQAPTAWVLSEAVELLNEGGGRSSEAAEPPDQEG